ncbi:hypothetical protein PG991_014767 [Apiospora marii]|uniref:Uncharacterized protein n=1 Tax=Apiospora marii TaxID=335849 RepID=A0ABR1R4F8_9PEZI
MEEREQATQEGTTADEWYLRGLKLPDRLWGWNLSAADLPKFREAAGDDDQLSPVARRIKFEMRKTLEHSLDMSEKCSALGDDRSCLYSRRAAAEAMLKTGRNIHYALIRMADRLPRTEEYLSAVGSGKRRTHTQAFIQTAEKDNLELLRFNLAVVQSLAFGEAWRVFLREIQQVPRHPELMRNVVVPFIAPPTGEASGGSSSREDDQQPTTATSSPPPPPPRLENGALWLARLSRQPALTRYFSRDFFTVRGGFGSFNCSAMFQIASGPVLAHRPDLARVVGWALRAERLKCEIHLEGTQRLIRKWDRLYAHLLGLQEARKEEWPGFLPKLTKHQRQRIRKKFPEARETGVYEEAEAGVARGEASSMTAARKNAT